MKCKNCNRKAHQNYKFCEDCWKEHKRNEMAILGGIKRQPVNKNGEETPLVVKIPAKNPRRNRKRNNEFYKNS